MGDGGDLDPNESRSICLKGEEMRNDWGGSLIWTEERSTVEKSDMEDHNGTTSEDEVWQHFSE